MTVGRFVAKKGHAFLVEACAILAKQGFDFECLFVGGDPKRNPWVREDVEQRIKKHGLEDKVKLLGARGEEDILELYKTSHIFALACVKARSGDQDGMPNALIESMSCGLPVVTTPITGIPDLIEDGKNGFMVPVKDAEALAAVLADLIKDEQLRERIGSEARKTILDGYRIEDTTRELAAIFQRLSGSAPSHPSKTPTPISFPIESTQMEANLSRSNH